MTIKTKIVSLVLLFTTLTGFAQIEKYKEEVITENGYTYSIPQRVIAVGEFGLIVASLKAPVTTTPIELLSFTAKPKDKKMGHVLYQQKGKRRRL